MGENASSDITNKIEDARLKKTLVRLSIVKSKGVRFNILCRIIHYDEATAYLTVYHDDEKKVYQFRLNEIDDFTIV
jgi:hypothetical protein